MPEGRLFVFKFKKIKIISMCVSRTRSVPHFTGQAGKMQASLNHYFDGIQAALEARTEFNKPKHNELLRGVASQMEYVSTGCASGWTLSELDDVSGAIKHYQLALRENPKYVEAYLRWSNLYV